MKNNYSILLFFCLQLQFAFGQIDDPKFKPVALETGKELKGYNFFESQCREETDSLKKLDSEREILAVILNSKSNDVRSSTVTLEDNWQLLSLYENYWGEVIGTKPYTEMYTKYFIIDSITPRYSTLELYNLFEISDSTFGKEFPLTELPAVFERTDLYNGKWTITYLSSEKIETLFIRLINSHPHGNQTSSYQEKLFIFRKTNNEK